MCGVFGIFNHREAARLTYLGLQQLQHRGQESAGIVTSDGNKFYSKVSMGLVSDVFKPGNIDKLVGRQAIGHVRYATAGSSSLDNAQPFTVTTARGPLAIGHNGNLTNAGILRKKLESQGSIFQTSSDTEVLLHLIAKSPAREVVSAIKEALVQVTGAYSLVLQTPKTLFAIRDPWGVRPLHLGKLNGSYVVASETCSFDLLGARFIREIKPGEILAIDQRGAHTVAQLPSPQRAHCVFEYVYFARPDSQIYGKSVYEVRRELGRQLAREAPVKADIVCAVPDSASVAAVGYADESHIPLEIGLIRSHYRGRTFIEPKQSIRDFGARMKYAAAHLASALTAEFSCSNAFPNSRFKTSCVACSINGRVASVTPADDVAATLGCLPSGLGFSPASSGFLLDEQPNRQNTANRQIALRMEFIPEINRKAVVGGAIGRRGDHTM